MSRNDKLIDDPSRMTSLIAEVLGKTGVHGDSNSEFPMQDVTYLINIGDTEGFRCS